MIRILIIIMDTPSLNSTNSHRRKLVKKKRPSHQQPPPPSSGRASNAGRDDDYSQSTRSSNSLTRRPSAPHAHSSQHYTTSTASSPQQPDPSQGGGDFALPLQDTYPNYLAGPTYAPSGQTAVAPDDFIGAPFDSAGILNRLDAAKPVSPILIDEQYKQYGPQSPSQRSHASPVVARYSSDLQRFPSQPSPGFANMDASSEKSLSGRLGADHSLSATKRLSDDGRESKGGGLRKKSGLSNFVNSLVGAPKKPVISAPENPVHLTHVGYDSNTGQFTVRGAMSYPDSLPRVDSDLL